MTQDEWELFLARQAAGRRRIREWVATWPADWMAKPEKDEAPPADVPTLDNGSDRA